LWYLQLVTITLFHSDLMDWLVDTGWLMGRKRVTERTTRDYWSDFRRRTNAKLTSRPAQNQSKSAKPPQIESIWKEEKIQLKISLPQRKSHTWPSFCFGSVDSLCNPNRSEKIPCFFFFLTTCLRICVAHTSDSLPRHIGIEQPGIWRTIDTFYIRGCNTQPNKSGDRLNFLKTKRNPLKCSWLAASIICWPYCSGRFVNKDVHIYIYIQITKCESIGT